MQKTLQIKITLGRWFAVSEDIREAAWAATSVAAIFVLAAVLAAATL